jgi:FMN-dependent oxidoreductase (nitrilotriacetate monooxygenase family)
MSSTLKKMALSIIVSPTNSHPSSWLHPEADNSPGAKIDFYRDTAVLAEKGLIDLFFVADTPAARTENFEAWGRYPAYMNSPEPVTLLAALSGATKHIGLGGTVSTSFAEPYNVARQFASIDHFSGGRVAWNVVTSANDYAARNFGHTQLAPHATRYQRAGEFVDVVRKLWDSWDDDAFPQDRSRGVYLEGSKQHAVKHKGEFFDVEGALNIARAPQGHPVIIQAGASDAGQELAARTADVVFSVAPSIEGSRAFYNSLKGRMAKYGREPDELKVLAGMPMMIAATDAEAEAEFEKLQQLIHPDVGRFRLGTDLETDLSDLDVDEPIPAERLPKEANFHKVFFEDIKRLMREGNLTVRQLYLAYERGRRTIKGSPKTIADTMQAWFEAGVCDGFMLQFHLMPGGLEAFVRDVVPELQRRGLMRTEYQGTTLREHLGLARPQTKQGGK